MNKEINRTKGLSPVIASVLLIVIVIAIVLIIFLWLRVTIKVPITKFDKNIALVCEDDVSFTATYSNGKLNIVNGNTPIYGLKIRIYESGGYHEEDATSFGWPEGGLRQAGSWVSEDISSELANADKILIIPVLLGSSEQGKTAYVCDADTGIEKEL